MDVIRSAIEWRDTGNIGYFAMLCHKRDVEKLKTELIFNGFAIEEIREIGQAGIFNEQLCKITLLR